MAVIHCKNCGGSIELSADKTFGTCEFCGSTMTFPKVDDDQRAAAFNRGNHFRRIGEFDKALAVYERIVAEDNTDAEAHWCCALCRFGIEYVEDPATLEWIPTCHRASFDSFLEDVDYKAALEHSDGVTRRQYQKEANKIAEVQRGILAQSQNAEPYDVFICYKETDESGDRTRDSLLAQEIYYQLTEEGRKVFFARITLESVAGQKYEPIIFAALNSAKVMIVVGTRPEHLNAVWVKNEWSRFLAMMKKDRTRLLLPCYRDMDPYDLPDQLSVLQSYDMAKIGFIQDLIHGINKVLSPGKPAQRQESAAVQQVPAAGNTSALLKRGFMALEDGEWKQADEFFEEVLNQDAECGEAYLGKTLASEQVADLNAFVVKKLGIVSHAKSESLSIPADTARCETAVKKYAISGYLDAKDIRALYPYELTYSSTVTMRKRQREALSDLWDGHKHLSRATRFAGPELAKQLSDRKAYLLESLDMRVQAAESAAEKSKKNLQDRYSAHLDEADAKAEKLYQQAWSRRNQDYRSACAAMERAKTSYEFNRAAGSFDKLGNYENSLENARICRQKARDYDAEQARIAAEEEAERRCIQAEQEAAKRAEAERQRIIREREEAARKAKNKRNTIIGAIVAAIVLVVVLVLTQVVFPAKNYEAAGQLLSQGDFRGAMEKFEALGGYKDSEQAASYAKARVLMEAARNMDEGALELLGIGEEAPAADPEDVVAAPEAPREEVTEQTETEDYQIVPAQLPEVKVYLAEDLMMVYRYISAAEAILNRLGTYRDSAELLPQIPQILTSIQAQRYEQAAKLLAGGEYKDAMERFCSLNGYLDSKDQATDARNAMSYEEASSLHTQESYREAAGIFLSLEALGYSDSNLRANESKLNHAMSLLACGAVVQGQIDYSRELLISLGDDPGAQNLLKMFVYRRVGEQFENRKTGTAQNATIYYDSYGRVWGTSLSGTVNEYDEKGQLIKDDTYTYEYNKKGQVSKKYYESSWGSTSTYTYTYTNKGEVASYTYEYKSDSYTSKSKYTYKYTYDKSGRLSTQKEYKDGEIQYTMTCTYNDAGQLVKETYQTQYEYKNKIYDSSRYYYEYTYYENGDFATMHYTYPNYDHDQLYTYTYGYVFAPDAPEVQEAK